MPKKKRNIYKLKPDLGLRNIYKLALLSLKKFRSNVK